jgi:hypothetical protein
MKIKNFSTLAPKVKTFFSLSPLALLTNKLALVHENLLQPSLMFASKVRVGYNLRMEAMYVAIKAHKRQPECCEDFKNVQHWHQKTLPISFSLFPLTLLTNKLACLHENLLQPSLMFANKVCVGYNLKMEALYMAVKPHKVKPECCEDFKNVQHWHQKTKPFFSLSTLTLLTNKLALLHENFCSLV